MSAKRTELSASEIIDRFGGIRPLAKRLGLSASTVQGWKERGSIPDNRIEGVLRAANEDGISLETGSVSGMETRAAENSRAENPRAENRPTENPSPSAENPSPSAENPSPSAENRPADNRAAERRSALPPRRPMGPDFVERRRGADRRAGADRRRDVQLARMKSDFVSKSIVSVVLMTVVLVIAGAFLMGPEYLEYKKQSEQVAVLEAQLLDMNKRLGAIHSDQQHMQSSLAGEISTQIQMLQQRMHALAERTNEARQQAAGKIDSQTLGQRLVLLQDEANSLNNTLVTLQQLLASFEASGALPPGAGTTLARLSHTLSQLQASLNDMNAVVSSAQKENQELTRALDQLTRQDMQAAAMLAALTRIREQMNRNAPFEKDLEILKKSVGDNPQLVEAIDRLAPHAQQGVLSPDRLKGELNGLAGDIFAAKFEGRDLSVKEAAQKRPNNLMTIQKDGALQGDSAEAAVARAQSMLDQGDVQGAIAELQALQGPEAKAAEPFLQKAQGAVAAQDVTTLVSQTLLDRLMRGQSLSIDNVEDALRDIGRSVGATGLPTKPMALPKQRHLPDIKINNR